MVKGYKIEKEVNIKDFLEIIKNYKEEKVEVSDHAVFRLDEAQRKVFKEKILKEYVLNEIPILAGIQFNGNYSIFYEYGKDILKIVLDISYSKVIIVTFYILDKKQLPQIK